MESKLPKCAVLPCPNVADPRYFARDVNARPVMICDGHEPMPKPTEVAARPLDPTALDLAARVVRNGYWPTTDEVESIARALIVDQGELADLRALAFALYADIDLSPELLKVKQRLINDRSAKQMAKVEAEFADAWDRVQRDNVSIVRCRRCGFETFPFSDAAIVDHMQSRCVYVALPSEVPPESKVQVMRPHIVNGKFQSDKYPTCPPGKVPLSVEDPTAQDLLWQYAHRRRAVDAEFADDLEACLVDAGYLPTKPASTEAQNLAAIAFSFLEILTPDQAKEVIPKLTNVQHDIILEMLRIRADS